MLMKKMVAKEINGKELEHMEDTTFMELSKDFASNTTAHGLPRIISSKSVLGKLFWLAVFLSSLSLFVVQTQRLFTTFFSFPVDVTTTVVSGRMLDFPTVTVCNINMLKRSLIEGTEFATLTELDTEAFQRALYEAYMRRSQEESYDTEEDEYNITTVTDQDGSGDDDRHQDDDSNAYYNGHYYYDDDYIYHDYYDYNNEFNYEYLDQDDQSFLQGAANDSDFRSFAIRSKTSDFSDISDTLRPTFDDLDRYGNSAKDLIIQCSYNKKQCTYRDFHKTYNAKYGNCYTFNHGINETIRKTNKFGSMYGLRLTLNIDVENYIGMYAHGAGARVAVHSHNVTPFPEDQGISAPPGRKTNIGVRLHRIERTQPPHGQCTNGKEEDLMEADNGKTYSVLACSAACRVRNVLKMCGCLDKLVNATDTKYRCSFTNTTQWKCRTRVQTLYEAGKLGCDCPDSCLELSYQTTISNSNWPNYHFRQLLKTGLMMESMDDTLREKLSTTYEENLVRVHIYFEELNFVSIKETPSYTIERLLADIGGTLGLFLGLSVITAFEIVTYLGAIFKFLACKVCKQNKINPKPTETLVQPFSPPPGYDEVGYM